MTEPSRALEASRGKVDPMNIPQFLIDIGINIFGAQLLAESFSRKKELRKLSFTMPRREKPEERIRITLEIQKPGDGPELELEAEDGSRFP